MPTNSTENQEWKHSFPQPFCLLSRFREKLSIEGQPRNHRALAEPCQGLCSESRRTLVSLQRNLCVHSLRRELFPLATFNHTVGKKLVGCSLRVSMRKLAGWWEERKISPPVSESPAQGLLGMWKLLHEPTISWWALRPFKMFCRHWLCWGVFAVETECMAG